MDGSCFKYPGARCYGEKWDGRCLQVECSANTRRVVGNFAVNWHSRNACEGTGWQPISSEVECQKAAGVLGLEFRGDFGKDGNHFAPKGCIESTNDAMYGSGVFFNTDSQGEEYNEGHYMICKTAANVSESSTQQNSAMTTISTMTGASQDTGTLVEEGFFLKWWFHRLELKYDYEN